MTNIHDALWAAFSIAEPSSEKQDLYSGPDTVFLVSSAAPSAGEVVNAKLILEAVKAKNRLMKIRIHTVCFSGEDVTKYTKWFMKKLARGAGGRFVECN